MSAILASSLPLRFFLRRGFEIGNVLDRYAKLRKKLGGSSLNTKSGVAWLSSQKNDVGLVL